MDKRKRYFDGDLHGDDPIYSRLFVVYDRKMQEDDLRTAFTGFGHIENIKVTAGSNGQPKGVCFIKFSKTSEAADALEAMHLKVLPNAQRPIKVLVATNRSEVERYEDDEEKHKRLFIHVPRRNMQEDELENIFAKHGKLRSVVIQKDHFTGISKGFAYVTYSKFSEAARAYEECSRQFRPIFAKPKWQRRPETSFESNINHLARSGDTNTSLISMLGPSLSGKYRGIHKVNFLCCPDNTQVQMERLFDLIPGMIYCDFFIDLLRNCGKGTVEYSNPNSAFYAVEKLHEFEYPPGQLIFVQLDNSPNSNIPGAVSKLRRAIKSSTHSGIPDLAQLTNAIAEASKVIKMATGGVIDEIPDSDNINYCSVKLPPPRPLADIDSNVAKRCFLICKPAPPPLTVLRDIFCRFGDLINVYTLPNKTVGYARYASIGSADQAINILHGAEVCGVRMKVLEAEEEALPRKRRYEHYD